MIIDLAACDIVFLSFDEPNADSNFGKLSSHHPRARRVHGVKGFDAAHRKAGEISTTKHVITVDADNVVIDQEFLTGTFEIAPRDAGSVFSFSARNILNGLEYGNGGVKIWPRDVLLALRTHENAERAEAAVDFCWTVPYYQVNRVLSEVHMTATPAQAFRGGFREGVKFNLADGVLAYDALPDLPQAEALPRHIGAANYERLRVWCTVGADVSNGDWAILGARLGCVMTALDKFDTSKVADYDWFSRFWSEDINPNFADAESRQRKQKELGNILNKELDLQLAELDAAGSAFFKSTYRGRRAYGQMRVV